MSVLSTVASVFLLLLVGAGAKRFGVLRSGDATVINSTVINLTGPAFIFAALHGKPLTLGMCRAPLAVIVSTLIALSIAYAFSRMLKLDRPTTGGLMLASSFGNTGFLGYPVVIAAFPNEPGALATAVLIDQFAMSILLVSIGVMIATHFTATKMKPWQALQCLRTPLFLAAIVAIVLNKVVLPAPIDKSIQLLAAATVPLSMISIGLSLTRSAIRSISSPFFVALALKMLLLPLLTYIGITLLGGEQGTTRQVAVLESSMPPAILSGIIAQRYGSNGAFVAGAILLMTLLSIATVPLILTIVH